MKQITSQIYDAERALYGLSGAEVTLCHFTGPADGESALKESRDVTVRACSFELRYPLWHCHHFKLQGSRMTETCRAPLWYSSDGVITRCTVTGVKALRECEKISISGSDLRSTEFGWRCRDICAEDSSFESEYFFFESERLEMKSIRLKGKYSFQYVRGLRIMDSELDTKDSFWHAQDVLVENSVIRGEYLGWYSKNLTLKNCTIIGTQPFCYCENLRLIDCELIDCDLAFEYSTVEASLRGHVVSIKNPRAGRIIADSVGEIIRADPVYECAGEVLIRG